MGVAAAEITTAICSAVAIIVTLVSTLAYNFRSLQRKIDNNQDSVMQKLSDIQATMAVHGERLRNLEDKVTDHSKRIEHLEHSIYFGKPEDNERAQGS